MKPRTAKEWADLLVDNVSTCTQLDPDQGELPNVDDWRRNAEVLFAMALGPELASPDDDPDGSCGMFEPNGELGQKLRSRK